MDSDTADCSARHTSDLERRPASNSSGTGLRRGYGFVFRRNFSFNDQWKIWTEISFVKELRCRFVELRPIDVTRHRGERCSFVFKDLKKTDHMFIRHDGPMVMLQLPYDGSFAVVTCNDKNFTIRVHGKNITVSIDRVKPAYLLTESLIDAGETTNNQRQYNQTLNHQLNDDTNSQPRQ